jgi:hypothetical protein
MSHVLKSTTDHNNHIEDIWDMPTESVNSDDQS